MREFRSAIRSLARAPGFTAAAVVVLSLSVGATTAVFSLLHALVLRPIPVPDPYALVQLSTVNGQGRVADLTWDQHRELAARQSVFSAVIASIQQGVFTVETGRTTARASVSGVSGNYYRELGAHAAIGRLIEPADIDEASVTAQPVAVLGWDFWQRELGGDPAVLDRTIRVEAVPLTIIGVAQQGFLGLGIAIEHDITVPIALVPEISQTAMTVGSTVSWVATTGRLRPGVTPSEARAQIEALWPGLLRDTTPPQLSPIQRDEYAMRAVVAESGATGIERGLRRRYTQALYVLQAIAAGVVLVAGANLCSLIFARAQARRHELAVRLALGSSRARLLREFVVEGALLGAGGAAAGLTLAAYATRALTGVLLRDYLVRTSLDTTPDRLVVLVAAAVSVGIAVTASTAAGILVTASRSLALSAGASRTVTRSSRTGRVLVGAQIALSVVLLSSASLLTRSVYLVSADDGDMTPDTVLVGYPTERTRAYRDLDPAPYYREALERVRALPGVTAAAFTPALQSGNLAHYKFLVVRAPEATVPSIQRALDTMGVETLPSMRTLDYVRGRTLLQERVMAALSVFFGALALLLASIGLYGLLSYVLSLRRKEIGIRMALGADAGRMARTIFADGLTTTAAGISLGLVGVVASMPLLRSVLVGMSPYDPTAITAACLVLLVATLAAALAPAARAARVEPLSELRRD